jgi:hypothetical protein
MSRAGAVAVAVPVAVAVAVERKICATPTALTIRPRMLKFWFPASFGST